MSKRFKSLLLILAFVCCWGLWNVFLDGVVPRKRTFFLSYKSFIDKAGMYFYPNELPSSAEDIKYFYYRGGFDTRTGISFTVNKEEYQEFKEMYLSIFKERKAERKSSCWYEFDEKVTPEFLEEEELNDLKYLFHGSEESYIVLVYEITRGAHTSYYLEGIICNDERNEIIIFDFTDKVRKEKRDSSRGWDTEETEDTEP